MATTHLGDPGGRAHALTPRIRKEAHPAFAGRLAIGLVLMAALSLAIVPSARAHAPLGTGGNESLAGATIVPDPTKSWAIYGDLQQGGEARYYRFEVALGQKVHIMLFTTTSVQDVGFLPGVVLMGPGIAGTGTVPAYVETPPGAGAMAVRGSRAARAAYEPFSPSAFVQLAEITITAPASGTYFVAVHDDARGGHYGLAIGEREAFTLSEWLRMPLVFPALYAWEWQSLPLVFLPALIVCGLVAIGIVRRHRRGRRLDLIGWMAAAAGLLFLATAVTTLAQTILSVARSSLGASVVVTLVFVGLQAALGWVSVRIAVRSARRWTVGSRIQLVLVALVAVAVWAGYVVGPLLLVVASFVPAPADPDPV